MKPKCHPELVSGSHKSKHAGVSLIIAIIFVAALMLVMAGLFEVRIRVIQAIGNRETEAKAQYLAQSAAELASFWAATHGVGRNTADEADTPAGIAAMNAFLAPLFGAATDLGITNCADIDGNATNGPPTPCVGVEVVNRPADADQKVGFNGADFFSAPIRGSGDAEDGIDCGTVPAADLAEADHPCNWNRMRIGQTVEIPLYYEEADGTTQKLFDPNNDGNTEDFLLRVRTPACTGGAGCINDRLILYPQVSDAADSAYRDPEKDPVLVQWSVFDAGGTNAITAWDVLDEAGKRRVTPYATHNTEISAGRINLANVVGFLLDSNNDRLDSFVVLKFLNSTGDEYDKHSGKRTLDKQRQFINSAINSFAKPTMRLSLVGQPQRNMTENNTPFTYPASLNQRESFDIPYLEYQLLTKNSPSSDTRILVIGWAEIGGFRKEFRKYIKRATSASGFAIESF